jgi:hypothetical protein
MSLTAEYSNVALLKNHFTDLKRQNNFRFPGERQVVAKLRLKQTVSCILKARRPARARPSQTKRHRLSRNVGRCGDLAADTPNVIEQEGLICVS